MPGMCADSSSGREVSRRVHFLALSLWRLEQIVRSGRDPFFSVNGEAGYLHSGPFPSGVPSEIPMEIFREKAVRVLDKAKRQGIMMIAIDEPAYPEILLRLPDPPLVLFFRGVLPGRPGIAMVGTRRPTVEARRGFESLAAGLSRFGLPIVSGLAAGLDAAAHRGALLGKGTTVAVVGTGLDRVYPDFHRTLAGEILSGGGCIVSEFPPGSPPDGWHFPFRNRIVVGLSAGIVAGPHRRASGTSVTVRRALGEGRDVVVYDRGGFGETTEGPEALLEQGARRVSSAEDVILALGETGIGGKEVRQDG
ncbi:DNA-processing protein DprA [Leptospirillum ferriphilum]|jgi:DNA processing protein|uniref:Rossmann fold nucleotide-binding protein Smf n=2 Tax=Leptospirillum TaxID=179 RepID=A0A094WBY6_9BACT|nr:MULTISPECIES: DNA-processing protein DprA [Leptospirillum]AKS22696.1 DNA processing protein [Leptospirillum sp. Group II 'CF-1']EDZ39584.1 MAG: DNA processing protein DprA [Leptospirillum sp. Group II '5-way CG']EIJ75417.1 MAG: DNA processing protein DprA [Leptospirillum sp. Group II 'C75']KGA95048.1 Rossmann fold nucleotide-binding protein Smf [Leptospirillum ferriphilum]